MEPPGDSHDLRSGFTLGTWTVLPNQNRIEDDTVTHHLEPKVMEVLCVLAAEQGEVVSRTRLLDTVWTGTVVTDEVLSRAISVLRGHLGDDPRNPEYIATVPKAGYRLIEPVTPLARPAAVVEVDPASPPGPEAEGRAAAGPRNWIAHGVVAVLVFVLVLLGLFFRAEPPRVPVDPRSPTLFSDLSEWFELIIRGETDAGSVLEIAVLPFDDLSEEAGNAFLSDGLTDELIVSLGQLEGLKVVARSSSLSFRNRHEDVRSIGDILRVDAVVEGTVRRVGDQLRISVQLSSTEDGFALWSQTFDRNLGDLLALQQEIATDIVSALQDKLQLNALQPPPARSMAPDMEAYQFYLNGRFLWKLRGESPLRRSIELFDRALQLDPDFTRARLALANSLVLLPYYSAEDEEEAFARALSTLEAIEAMSPVEAGEIEAIYGFIAFRRWQWQLAEEHFHKGLLLAPNNPNIYVWYSQLLSAVGRNSDALKTARQARDLDAVSPVVNHRLAIAYLWNGDNVSAAEQFALGEELGFVNLRSPGYLVFLLRLRRYEEARRVLKQLYAAAGVDPTWMLENIEAIAGGGDSALRKEAREAVARGDVFPRLRLGLWLYLEEPEEALAVVEDLRSQKKYVDMELIFSEEGRSFRDSSEFEDLVEEIGLESFWDSWRGPDSN